MLLLLLVVVVVLLLLILCFSFLPLCGRLAVLFLLLVLLAQLPRAICSEIILSSMPPPTDENSFVPPEVSLLDVKTPINVHRLRVPFHGLL